MIYVSGVMKPWFKSTGRFPLRCAVRESLETILKCLLAASVFLLLLVFLQWVNFLNFFLRPKCFCFVTYSLLPVSLVCRLGSAALCGHVRFLGFRRVSDAIFRFFHEVLWPNCQVPIFQLIPTCYFVKFFCSMPQHWTRYSNRHHRHLVSVAILAQC